MFCPSKFLPARSATANRNGPCIHRESYLRAESLIALYYILNQTERKGVAYWGFITHSAMSNTDAAMIFAFISTCYTGYIILGDREGLMCKAQLHALIWTSDNTRVEFFSRNESAIR